MYEEVNRVHQAQSKWKFIVLYILKSKQMVNSIVSIAFNIHDDDYWNFLTFNIVFVCSIQRKMSRCVCVSVFSSFSFISILVHRSETKLLHLEITYHINNILKCVMMTTKKPTTYTRTSTMFSKMSWDAIVKWMLNK